MTILPEFKMWPLLLTLALGEIPLIHTTSYINSEINSNVTHDITRSD